MVVAAKTQTPKPVEVLLDKIKQYNPNCDEALIRKAYDLGKKAHEGQFRKSGEPYFCHPVEVAELLTEIRIDDATIITALLHDTVEDTNVTHEDIAREFGEEIAGFVDGVTKLSKLELGKTQSAEVENLRKLLLAVSKDVRVMLVKLADRLHNMRTIKAMPPEKQRKKARETMDIYAPLAERMGMRYLREELEDLSFEVLNPKARLSIIKKFVQLRGESGDVLNKILGDIREALGNHNIAAQVTGREKRPYSIWRKIQSKGEGFERLSDIYGFRILTNSIQDCYRALGAVHGRYSAIPGRFKDYISQPKPNGYRSIHTTVLGRDGKRVEVQIRTRQMHVVAESGVAAHWAYKDGKRVENPYQVDPSLWLADLAEGNVEHEDDEEFLEQFKTEMYSNQVFVFSPKGKVVRLPRGATAIDFAYAIHSDLGNHTVGALVDGNRWPLSRPLRNGQTIHIIRAQGAQPEANWTQTVKTSRAKTAIRRAFKDKNRAHKVQLGQEIARVAFEQIGKKLTDKALDSAAHNLGIASREQLLEQLASAEITGGQLIQTLFPEMLSDAPKIESLVALPPMIGSAPAYAARPCRVCFPIPGDRIVGIAKKGQGLCYHVVDCHELEKSEDDPTANWIDLRWPEDREGAIYSVRVLAVMANDAGVLGRICTMIGENRANIEQLDFIDKRPDFYSCLFEIGVRDVQHLQHILTAIHTDPAIAEVRRYRDEPQSIQFAANNE